MSPAAEACRVVSIVAFSGYGVFCLTSPLMVAEFERYRVPGLRVLTGWLEIAGALGVLGSYWRPELLAPAAGGLALLMAFAVATRLRIRDSLLQSTPAFALLLSNGFLAATALGSVAGGAGGAGDAAAPGASPSPQVGAPAEAPEGAGEPEET